MCHRDHKDYVCQARCLALDEALQQCGLPPELCREVCAFVPPSPLCSQRAYELLQPHDVEAMNLHVLVDGQEPLTLWHTESGQHSLTITRQMIRLDHSRRLVYVDTRDYDVRIAPKTWVAEWYHFDDTFVTVLAEVQDPWGPQDDVYTLLYHPYCLWEDARSDVCGIMDVSPAMIEFLQAEGMPLRSDVDWTASMHMIDPAFYESGTLLLAAP